jgi:uncharacterized protein with ATP-grasp and redox domains
MMRTSLDCIPCFFRQALEGIRMLTEDTLLHERAVKKVAAMISSIDLSQPPPLMGQRIHHLIRDTSGVEDPYDTIKKQYNHFALTLYPALKKQVKRSSDRFTTALRLAIAGNIIDFGVTGNLSKDNVRQAVNESLAQPLNEDVIAGLRLSVSRAQKILYLGDNAGEIVFDRLFIEEMPVEKITFAVRGGPVINDVTLEDAKEVGLSHLVEVIDNGSDVPGTLLQECSEEFRKIFECADLIIAKGQGNYETLNEMEKNIYFLFKVKCLVTARHTGCNFGSFFVGAIHEKSPDISMKTASF